MINQGPILVTGAAGFVGRHLLPMLQTTFPECTLIATARAGGPGLRALDVTESGAVAAFIEEVRPTACVHLAGISAIALARGSPARAWRVNLHGTLCLAHAIVKHSPECLFLFVSSADIYGRSFDASPALDEAALLAPLNTYAVTKAAADLAIGALAEEGLRAIRVRPFNHTGPGQSDAFVVASFARQIARIKIGLQEPRIVVGALDSFRDFLNVHDVCAAYIAALRCSANLASGMIFNIASGVPRRIGDILTDLLTLADVAVEIRVEGARLRRAEIPRACGNAERARSLLSWTPTVPWRQTLVAVLADWEHRVRTVEWAEGDRRPRRPV
ncbi:MAG: GDP-mannose 4,6-dehydratase [Acetobacteraceae bacterium]|nr:GDP-mannose 4,6-dehydratase [Acetobacteraceae bacterium]